MIATVVFCLSAPVWAQLGRRAENFSAMTMKGEAIDLASLKGKVVVLAFWSTRCPICQSELPNLNKLVAGYTRKEVVFIAATAENTDIVKRFLRKNSFDFQILPDSFGLMLKYSDRDSEGRFNISYPAYYIIDRTGRIRYKGNGWDQVGPLTIAIDRSLANR